MKMLRDGLVAIALTAICLVGNLFSADQYVVVVLDDSGSMDRMMDGSSGQIRKMDAAKQSLLEVLNSLASDTRVGVLALNSSKSGSPWIIPLAENQAPGNWAKDIQQIAARGGTQLGEKLKLAADELLAIRAQKRYGTYRLLVVSDGEANDPRMVHAYLQQILGRGLTLDVIGVDMEGELSLATQAHSYRRADDIEGLKRAISEVFAETALGSDGTNEDFELLAGLPDGFAERALQSLTMISDEPLESGEQFLDENPAIAITAPSASVSSVASLLVGGVLCCGALLAGVVVIGIIFSVIRPRKRRR